MTEPKIRAIVWGCGHMGQIIIKYLKDKGVELVGAIDRNVSRVGKDAGEISALKRSLGTFIHHPDEAKQVFHKANANVCIISTRSLMIDIYDSLEMSARHGVNAITLAEEAFYPWNTSPDLTQKLDKLAKEHNCTLTGSGFQDVFLGNLISILAAGTHRIDRIQAIIQYNIDGYGSSVAAQYGVGLSVEAFKQQISGYTEPFPSWYMNEWLCAHLGLAIRTQKQEFWPITNIKTIHSTSLKTDISVGSVTGMKAVVTTETEKGVIIENQVLGKIYTPDEIDTYECTLVGEPTTTLTIHRPATAQMTCASLVNRLQHLIDAPPGFVTTDKMQPPNYWM
uniref:FidO2 n=1 Tax=Fischerella muscicola UTEX 1829 TaxID=83542 RepID=A0A1L1VXV4_FISMU|nr:FidO2 [Fischerella muscicola UTEX 1829]APZ79552.1 FimJ [Fischerella muscicola UTEX 1829]